MKSVHEYAPFPNVWSRKLALPKTTDDVFISDGLFTILEEQYRTLRENSPEIFDPAILPLLDAINKIPGFVTTWSCSGHPKDGVGDVGYFTICVNITGLANIFDFVGQCQVFYDFYNVDFALIGVDVPEGPSTGEREWLINTPTIHFSFLAEDENIRDTFLDQLTTFTNSYTTPDT